MGELIQPLHLLIIFPMMLIFAAVVIVPFWMIFKKAGFSPLLSLLMVIPLVSVIVLFIVAFSEWKVAPTLPGTFSS